MSNNFISVYLNKEKKYGCSCCDAGELRVGRSIHVEFYTADSDERICLACARRLVKELVKILN